MALDFRDIREAVLGEGDAMPGPFGPRRLIYADYVASGRALGFIEDAIRAHVLPAYGNTHTETSYAGRRTTALREMARRAVREAVGADDGHAVIFVGSGATGAADKLTRALALGGLDRRCVVFVGPYEHHSNDLPWRESGATVERVPLDRSGAICLASLEAALALHADAPMKIGAVSAASNVTGVLTDIRAVARLLHAHGAWCVADYAAAAPYVPVRLAESAPGAGDRIDAAFLSPHKYPGGPGASGLLVCDRKLLDTRRPTIAGGGTVTYVTATGCDYVSDCERREEAGTPAIIDNIRAGMALQLKRDVGEERIEARETELALRMEAALRAVPGLELLGPEGAKRLGIFAFKIRAGARMLHHNYVVALLNDLFGIQARGGCSCAGPHGHTLLGIGEAQAARHERAVARGYAAFRPGWVRLGVNWVFTDEDSDRIAEAVAFVARRGAALLPLYRLEAGSGVWRARRGADAPETTGLSALWEGPPARIGDAPDFAGCLAAAEALAAEAAVAPAPADAPLPREEEALRWFWLPHEARAAAPKVAA